uniref:Azurocidin n=1 Tax=Nomascus leucogenys TaxID=61853 RepID=G1QJP9_NOMLE
NPGVGTVVLGAYDLRRRERQSRQTFSISSMSENGYDPQQNLNDLMLLQVRGRRGAHACGPSTLGAPATREAEAGELLEPGRWTGAAGDVSPVFPGFVNVTVTPEDQCRPNNVCTGVLTRRGGICNGDGGTPLVCDGLAHGVASFSVGPCGRGPDFFTRVAVFRDWIDGVLNNPGPGPA